MIGKRQRDTKEHMYDSKSNGDLHLERIQKSDLVDGHLPNLKTINTRA